MLTFIYGCMGSSKTAQALIKRFNYIENGIQVWLIKPSTDTRDGENKIRSRIGLEAETCVTHPNDNICVRYPGTNVIVADESQFFTKEQIEQLRDLADHDVQVYAYGLKTNFKTELFEGSKRLIELADEVQEIVTTCECGHKATVNARLDKDGRVVLAGREVLLGGNDRYKAMCHKCFIEKSK